MSPEKWQQKTYLLENKPTGRKWVIGLGKLISHLRSIDLVFAQQGKTNLRAVNTNARLCWCLATSLYLAW